MSDYWVSTKRHYCTTCKCWLSSAKVMVIRNHEQSERHVENKTKQMQAMHARERERLQKENQIQKELQRIEKEAQEKVLVDRMLFDSSVRSKHVAQEKARRIKQKAALAEAAAESHQLAPYAQFNLDVDLPSMLFPSTASTAVELAGVEEAAQGEAPGLPAEVVPRAPSQAPPDASSVHPASNGVTAAIAAAQAAWTMPGVPGVALPPPVMPGVFQPPQGGTSIRPPVEFSPRPKRPPATRPAWRSPWPPPPPPGIADPQGSSAPPRPPAMLAGRPHLPESHATMSVPPPIATPATQTHEEPPPPLPEEPPPSDLPLPPIQCIPVASDVTRKHPPKSFPRTWDTKPELSPPSFEVKEEDGPSSQANHTEPPSAKVKSEVKQELSAPVIGEWSVVPSFESAFGSVIAGGAPEEDNEPSGEEYLEKLREVAPIRAMQIQTEFESDMNADDLRSRPKREYMQRESTHGTAFKKRGLLKKNKGQ